MKHFLAYGRFNEKDIPSFVEAKSNDFLALSKLIYEDKFSNIGTLSLSGNKYSTLMMAHYANESGFVIEFDSIKLERQLKSIYDNGNVFIFPMNYCKNVSRIDYFKYINYKRKRIPDFSNPNKTKINVVHEIIDLLPVLYMTSIKNEVWIYEDEWRILLRKQNMGMAKDPLWFSEYHNDHLNVKERKIYYDKECLKKIILGPLFFNNKYFKEKKLDINMKNNYFLDIEYLIDEKLLNTFRQFLKIISSEKFINKIYIQNLQIDEKGFERYSAKLENLSFKNDVFSFVYRDERY